LRAGHAGDAAAVAGGPASGAQRPWHGPQTPGARGPRRGRCSRPAGVDRCPGGRIGLCPVCGWRWHCYRAVRRDRVRRGIRNHRQRSLGRGRNRRGRDREQRRRHQQRLDRDRDQRDGASDQRRGRFAHRNRHPRYRHRVGFRDSHRRPGRRHRNGCDRDRRSRFLAWGPRGRQ